MFFVCRLTHILDFLVICFLILLDYVEFFVNFAYLMGRRHFLFLCDLLSKFLILHLLKSSVIELLNVLLINF